jgi:hypothetical protein
VKTAFLGLLVLFCAGFAWGGAGTFEVLSLRPRNRVVSKESFASSATAGLRRSLGMEVFACDSFAIAGVYQRFQVVVAERTLSVRSQQSRHLLDPLGKGSAVNAVKPYVVTTGDRVCFPWLRQRMPAVSIVGFAARIGEHESSRMRAGSLLWSWLNQVAEVGIKGRSIAIRRDVLPVHRSASAEPAALFTSDLFAQFCALGGGCVSNLHGPMVSLPARTQARRGNQQLNPNKTRQT